MSLEELDRVARGISSSRIWLPPIPSTISLRKARARRAQPLDLGGQVGDLELEAVPPAWASGRVPSGIAWPSAALRPLGTLSSRRRSPRESIGEGGRRMHDDFEAEVVAVEADRRVEVVNDAPGR